MSSFTYEGLVPVCRNYLTVYGTCMPMLNLTSQGLDIERFYPEDEAGDQATPIQLRCEYLIPDPPLTRSSSTGGVKMRRPPFPPPSRKPATGFADSRRAK